MSLHDESGKRQDIDNCVLPPSSCSLRPQDAEMARRRQKTSHQDALGESGQDVARRRVENCL
jgi:hypothetical protein